MIIGLVLAYTFMMLVTLFALAINFIFGAIAFAATFTIKNTPLRYLFQATIIALAFTVTVVPYEPASLDRLQLVDFLFKFGRGWGSGPPAQVYLANYAILKGMFTGDDHLFIAGLRPICYVASAFWTCAVALKYCPPWVPFLSALPSAFFGWILLHPDPAILHKITLDPLVLGTTLLLSSTILLFGSIISFKRGRMKITTIQKPSPTSHDLLLNPENPADKNFWP